MTAAHPFRPFSVLLLLLIGLLAQIATAQSLAISTQNLPSGQAGQAYEVTIQATGGTGSYTFDLAAGALPPGLTFNAAGVLSGSPSNAGAYSFTIRVTSGTEQAQRSFVLFVQSSTGSTLEITTVTLPQGQVQSAYQASISASGGTPPYFYEIVPGTGALPNGITLTTSGQFFGSPNVAGTFVFTVRVRDAAQPVPATFDRTLSITVNASGLNIITTVLPNAQQEQAYSATLSSTGGVQPYTYGVISGTLPPGITLAPSGTFGGAATALGTFNFRVRVTDGSNNIAERDLSITVVQAPLTLNTAPLPPAVLNNAYSAAITASGGSGARVFQLITGALPPGLGLNTNGAVSGTPTATGVFNAQIRVTDQASAFQQAEFTFTVNATGLTISQQILPNANLGAAYTAALTAQGGTAPYTFALAGGLLPAGLSLSNGVISGTPTAPGTFNFTVTITDDAAATANVTLRITVLSASITINTSGLPLGQVGQSYLGTVTATGGVGPYSFTVFSGNLPPGLTLNSSGTLSGTPTAAGSYTFTLRATDSNGLFADRSVTVTVAGSGLTILTQSLPNAVLNAAYSATISVTGGLTPYDFALISGQLPVGLNLNTAAGTITGTALQAGSYTFTIRVTDAFNAQALATYTVEVSTGTISVTPTTLTNATTGQPYTAQLTASGGTGNYNFVLASGQLPVGLSLSVGGLIFGTPTVTGTSVFAIRVTDSSFNTAEFTFSLAVTSSVLTILNPTLPNALVGGLYTANFLASGGTPGYSWSAPNGGVPAGLTLNSNGQITGTPTVNGTFIFLVRVTDSTSTIANANATLTVNAAGAVTITTTVLPSGLATVPYNQQLTAVGGTGPYSWELFQSSLPPGLTLSASGVISGTPTASGVFLFTVRVRDTLQVIGQSTLALTVSPGGLTITTSALPPAAINVPYQATLAATGGVQPYSFSLANGFLPIGLVLNSSGAITGTPGQTGLFPLTLQVSDANGATATTNLTLGVGQTLLQFGTTVIPNGVVGQNYSAQLQASGGSQPYTFSLVTGNLPAGLNLSGAGVIAGIPTAAGSFPLTLRVTDFAGISTTRQFVFIITQTGITLTNAAPPAATTGNSYTFTFTAAGGIGPYQYSVVNGAVPTGLTLSTAGVLSGTPTVTGGFGFTVRATDSVNNFGQSAYSIIVSPGSFVISTATLPNGSIGTPYSAALTTTGGVAPVTFFLQPGGTFPAGLTLNTNGTITGTPATAGTFNFTVGARDASPSQATAQRQYTVTISAGAPRFLTTSLAEGQVDVPYTQTLTATGGTGTLSFSLLSGTLPNGLLLAPNGQLSGTPRQGGAFLVTFRVTDSAVPPLTADFTTTLNIVASVPLTISSFLPSNAQLFFPYTTSFLASGGRAPYTFSIDAGSPPSGLRLSSDGFLTGQLLAPGSYSFRVRVADAGGQTATQEVTIVVNGPQYLAEGQAGVAYTGRYVPDFGQEPHNVSFNTTAAGRIPPGLTLATNGELTGTPTTPGDYTFGLLVRDRNGIFRLATAFVRVRPNPNALRITTVSLPSAIVSGPYQQTLAAAGGMPPYTWSVVQGLLPNGFQLNASSGVLTGPAVAAGPQSFTLQVRDAAGGIATQAYTIFVSQAGAPVLSAVTNAASYAVNGVVPGELTAMFGAAMGPAQLTGFTVQGNVVPPLLAGVRVLFDGIAAPLIFVRNDQLSAIVPWGIAGRPVVHVTVEFNGVQSPPFALPVLAARPGIFSANSTGSGPGAILNQDGSVNGPGNAAARGSVVVVYATGGGAMNPPGVDGRVAAGVSSLNLPVSASVGGVAADVLYAGNAPGLVEGVVQVNLRIPANAASGEQPLVLSVGSSASPATVTVSIQ